MGWDHMKSMRLIHRHKSFSHELKSEWVSERANEWAQQSPRAKWVMRGKRMIERCKQTSERRSEWPSSSRVKIIVFLPTVHSLCHSEGNYRVFLKKRRFYHGKCGKCEELWSLVILASFDTLSTHENGIFTNQKILAYLWHISQINVVCCWLILETQK